MPARINIMQISHSNQTAQAFAWPSFPQCAYAFSSDPALQNRRGPRVNNSRQLAFLECFLDGEWHSVSCRDENRWIDGVLLDLGWRFNYRRIHDDSEACSQYKLTHWQIRLLKRISRRFVEAT